GPCSGAGTSMAASDSVLRAFRRLASPGGPQVRATDVESPVAPWLAGVALLLLVGELIGRRAPGPKA
ncbi:MAG TPA: hypothetical protein VHE78_17370, partial [Gemmatimonadaceae bacterium]|nr:hypothetical protein [Gemmatimonadaceae bacterium]